jgi:hypothetical protein
LPHLSDLMWAVGQPVFHFRVPDPARFRPPFFSVWAADIANTGWYGFPAKSDGTLKVANHGPGRLIHPDEPRQVSPDGTLTQLARGRCDPISTAGRQSAVWGQPRLSAYLAWKRRARRTAYEAPDIAPSA